MSYIAKNGRLYTSGASEALTLLDDKFSVNKSYSKGDSCIYNDYLWKFTSDKPAGEWDNSVVEQCRIMDFVAPLLFNNAGAHNAIYRGKNLGTSVTTAQYNAIKAGTFDDLYIGDYWVINGVTWRIADFDYFLNCGDRPCTTHHAVIVPDTCLYNHVMNDTNTTNGGYVGSKMYTEGLEQAKTTIKAAFSGHVLKHRELLVNATVGGKPFGWDWFDSEVELMNEVMIYGSVAWGAHDSNGYNVASGNGQFHLFSHDHSRAHNRNNWWLRDVASAALFANVRADGGAYSDSASYSFGVRPAFCIS